ncbi:MAG: sigma-70 family RNA polymerase sigma factor [Clostridia bacterium]|nr:sigma-70 family RNA polymerase sigma factor [Clostridia bacterium]
MEDAAIIELYNARDERAIEETDRRYGRYCLTIAKNILSDEGGAQECVNDTWLAVWGLIPPEVPKCLRAFCGKITRNIALKAYARSTAKKRGGGETALVLDELYECTSGSDTEKEYEAKELSNVINDLLHTLPERECDIFIARYYFTYSVSEISKSHGLTENHVRTLLSRTRAKLRKLLKEASYI